VAVDLRSSLTIAPCHYSVNILLVSQPARDGVLRHVIGLVNFLLSQGDRVHLAYSDCNASDQLYTLVEQVQTSGGATLNLQVQNAPQPQDLPATLLLLSFIHKVKPDVIHAHSSKAGALVRGLALLGQRVPIFYSPHSYYRMHNPEDKRARVFHFLERIFGQVGTTITLSASESQFADRVIGVPHSRQLIAGNGVDFERFKPTSPEMRHSLRAQFNLPPHAKVLGSVGRFSAQKDPLSMYGAFAAIAHDLPDVHLVHVGQGELEGEVDAITTAHGISHRCHRIPYLRDTASFYRAIDGFLLTSRYEGMSYAILEALASNIPLILTRAPGNLDFMNYDFSHLAWCEPGNVTSIAAAIVAWYEALATGANPNHRETSAHHFSLASSFQPLREAYRQSKTPGTPAKTYASIPLGFGRSRNFKREIE